MFLDGIPQDELIAVPFDTLTEARLILGRIGPDGTTLPFTLPESPGLLRKAFDLQRYGTWRELAFQISSAADKLAVRSIRVTAFMDTIRLQTIPMSGIPGLGVAPPVSSGAP